jgi:molybdopterin biosynthesis enzyme
MVATNMARMILTDLLNVDKALEIILAQIKPLSPEEIHLSEALGRVLASDVLRL